MNRPPVSDPGSATSRDARRKAALRANLARRKAQARSRADETGAADEAGAEGNPDAAGNPAANHDNTAPKTAPGQEPSED